MEVISLPRERGRGLTTDLLKVPCFSLESSERKSCLLWADDKEGDRLHIRKSLEASGSKGLRYSLWRD